MHLVFIDEHRKERHALLTAIHGDPQGRMMVAVRKSPSEVTEDEKDSYRVCKNNIYAYKLDENGNEIYEYGNPGEHWPCVNLVVISDNKDAQDQYGRQLDERFTSIVHMGDNTAIGFCFRFPDEEVDWSKMQATIS